MIAKKDELSISLREVTKENFDECIELDVADSQKRFVGRNVNSIAESKVFPHLIPLAVYKGDELVGFSLHGKDPESKKYWIVRLMIGESFQGRGFGNEMTVKLIEKMKEYEDCDEIFLDFIPGNERVERLYTRLGFERTGKTDERGNIIMRLDLKAETRT